jgi:hypothetical protein
MWATRGGARRGRCMAGSRLGAATT